MTPYSILTVTPLLKESINCVLRAKRVDPSLYDELCQWVDGESKTISFGLVLRTHKESESLGRSVVVYNAARIGRLVVVHGA